VLLSLRRNLGVISRDKEAFTRPHLRPMISHVALPGHLNVSAVILLIPQICWCQRGKSKSGKVGKWTAENTVTFHSSRVTRAAVIFLSCSEYGTTTEPGDGHLKRPTVSDPCSAVD
jgi:hypothetical protein